MLHFLNLARVVLFSMPLAAFGGVVPKSVRVPISARQTGLDDSTNLTINFINFIKDLNYTLNKYQLLPIATIPAFEVQDSPQENEVKPVSRRSESIRHETRADSPMLNIDDLTLAVPLDQSIESTPQLQHGLSVIRGSMGPIPTLFDTSQDRYIVPSWSCLDCVGTIRYSEDGQDVQLLEDRYWGPSKYMRGRYFLDDVSVGPYTAKDVAVFSATSSNALLRTRGQTVAIMGLRSSTGYEKRFPTIVDKLIEQLDLAVDQFSFYIGRREDQTLAQSELLLGDSNMEHFTGQAVSLPLVNVLPRDQGRPWAVIVQSMKLNGRQTNAPPGATMIDTASMSIGMPIDVLEGIMREIPDSATFELPGMGASNFKQVWVWPCDTEIKLSFRMGDRDFDVDPRDLRGTKVDLNEAEKIPGLIANWPPGLRDGRDVCMPNLLGKPASNESPQAASYFLGLPFLRSYYATFDLTGDFSIKLAKSRPKPSARDDTVETT